MSLLSWGLVLGGGAYFVRDYTRQKSEENPDLSIGEYAENATNYFGKLVNDFFHGVLGVDWHLDSIGSALFGSHDQTPASDIFQINTEGKAELKEGQTIENAINYMDNNASIKQKVEIAAELGFDTEMQGDAIIKDGWDNLKNCGDDSILEQAVGMFTDHINENIDAYNLNLSPEAKAIEDAESQARIEARDAYVESTLESEALDEEGQSQDEDARTDEDDSIEEETETAEDLNTNEDVEVDNGEGSQTTKEEEQTNETSTTQTDKNGNKKTSLTDKTKVSQSTTDKSAGGKQENQQVNKQEDKQENQQNSSLDQYATDAKQNINLNDQAKTEQVQSF